MTVVLPAVGTAHPQLALRNDRGRVEGTLRAVRQTRSEQVKCRGQQEPGLCRVSRPNFSDQHGVILCQQRRSRKGPPAYGLTVSCCMVTAPRVLKCLSNATELNQDLPHCSAFTLPLCFR